MMHKTFKFPIVVQDKDLDQLQHVNNETYLSWLMLSASAHSNSLGFNLDRFLSDRACFVVRRHEINYLSPAYLNENLIVETWLTSMESCRTTRTYTITRKSDEKTLLRAQTNWVYVSLENGRPTTIPDEIRNAFHPYLEGLCI